MKKPNLIHGLTKFRYLFVFMLLTLLGAIGVKAEEYKLTILPADFNTTSYAANNIEKTKNAVSTSDSSKKYEVTWYSYQVYRNNGAMQWQTGKGYIYNKTDLGTIKAVNIEVSTNGGSYTTYYGTSVNPSESTIVGDGFFKIKVGNSTGKTTKIEVIFEIADTPSKTDIANLAGLSPTSLNVGASGEFSLDATYADGASYNVSWSSDNIDVLEVAGGTYEAKAVGTAKVTVKVTPTDTESYNEVSKSFEVTVVDPNGPGTVNNPYTVAQALENTPSSGNSNYVYIKGIVSKFQANDIISDGANYRYYISDDGTTNDQLLVFKGKKSETEAFSNVEDLQIGDVVVVYGQLTKYNNTKEIAADNYIVSLTRKQVPTLTFGEESYTVIKNGSLVVSVTSNSTGAITYASSNTDVAEINATTGAVNAKKAGTTTITASIDATEIYKAASATVELTVTAPKHFVSFYQSGTKLKEVEIAEDEAINFPSVQEEIFGKKFVGWLPTEIEGTADDASPVTSAVMGTADVTYYAVYAYKEGEDKTATLTEDEIKANFTKNAMTYGTPITYSDGDVTWIANAYSDQANRPWFQMKKESADSYLKMSVDGNVKNISLTITSANNSSGGILDITKHNAFSGNVYLEQVASNKPSGVLGQSSSVSNNIVSLVPNTNVNEVYIQVSAGARIWGAEISYGSATYSDYCTTVVEPVAQIGTRGYETLQAAVDAATEGATIEILKDVTLTTVTTTPSDKYNVSINKSITIDGKNHKITSSEGKRAIVLLGKANEVTIKNITLNSNKAEAVLWILDNLTCNLDNAILDGTNGKSYNQPLTIGSIEGEGRVTLNVTNGSVIKTNDEGTAHYSIIAWHPADITVSDSKLIGWANVYLKPAAAGSTVKISGSEMTSKGIAGQTNNFAIIVTESGNNSIEITDTKITTTPAANTYQSLFILGGEGNVVKFLGSTTYETSDMTYGTVTYNPSALKNNKVYFDDATKESFQKYFASDGGPTIANEKESPINLYPLNFEPEVMYYWPVEGGKYEGGYYRFAEPFVNGWLDNGEYIALQKNITLTEDITCQLGEGMAFNFLLGEFSVDKNGHSVSLKTGVTVKADKQTDIFSAAEEGYMIQETAVDGGYEYTVVEKPAVVVSAPVVFHDSGKYEAGLSVPMYAQVGAKIYYTTDGSEPTTASTEYTGALTIENATTLKAIAVLDGVASAVVTREYTIAAEAEEVTAFDGYYSIKNGTGKYINVAGRKTVTFVADGDEADKAGTVLKVKINTKGQVEELRSQGIDLPGYADKAMRYVPEIVQLVVDKLHAEGSGEILGENGLDSIMKKFNESFDYHLYIENANGNDNAGYRIYGKTPSMKPVVDFYAENKANVDYKLPQLEAFINSAIEKVLQKTGRRGASILVPFSLETVWENMGGTLTEPTDEVSTAKFYEEVLASEANVWNFAYQTAMIYWNKVKSHPRYEELKGKLGEYANYIEKVENIQPDFKYYIVGNTSGNGVDFISEGNTDIKNNAARTIWTLEPRTDFKVTFNKENSINLGRELYTTLYTDFAYTVPEKVKAYKVTAIDEKTGLATKEEISGVIPAQTPVLLQMIVDPKTVTDADLTQTLTLSTEAGTAVTGNLLQGPDALINAFNIKTAQVVSLFDMAKEFLGESAYNTYVKEYEHLMMKNAGTVNNKYFFGIGTAEDTENKIYSAGTTLRTLFKGDKKLGFYLPQDVVKANTAFILDETNPVLLSLVGDVTRDGKVNISDVTAQIDIILDKDTPEDNYDYDAADVDGNGEIKIKDVTDLIDIILGKNKTE